MAASCEPVRVDPDRVRGLQALLEPDAPPLQEGDLLPALWHWVALPRWGDPAATGHDGHPKRPGPLADVTAVRRMFAGGEVTLTGDLRVGERVSVDTEVGDVTTKSGRSGDFVLATFTSRIANEAGDVVVTERQDVVYTDPRPAVEDQPVAALPIVGRPLREVDGALELVTDPTVLLRFSALTANAHRIHYDLAYAREVERLPGLLVHGPLINLALVRAASLVRPGARVRRIAHRNLRPLYCGQRARLTAVEQDPGVVVAEITGPGEPATAVKGRVTVELDTTSERTPS